MIAEHRAELVLAIYFQSRGLAFVLFNSRRNPVDWGVPEFRGRDKENRCLKRVDALLTLHTPGVLVLQDTSKHGTRGVPRIQVLNRMTAQLAKRRGIPVHTYSRAQVIKRFEEFGGTTKQRIAETIAKQIPALRLYLPRPRKPWESENPRMGIFEATALACTHLQSTDHVAPF